MEGLLLGAIGEFCTKTSELLRLVGYVLTVFKVAIPLIIIVIGLIDLGKAAVSSKPEEIKKSVGSLIWRLVGGIAIFFVPMFVTAIFGWISGYGKAESTLTDWDVCYNCIIWPGSATCSDAVDTAQK